MPATQIAYNEFWRAPKEAQAAQVIISDIKAEITNLKQQQAQTLESLSSAVADKEKDAVAVLEDIKEVLERSSSNLAIQKSSD